MAKLLSDFALGHFLFIVFLGTVAAIGRGNDCSPGWPLMSYAAENRVLKGFTYATKTVRSAVICGSECSMDERCKSINFYKHDNSCEMNSDTRHEHADDFYEDQGSVYFDGDENTPLCSLADIIRYEKCQRLYEAGYTTSGVFTIYPAGFTYSGLQVYCDMKSDDGGAWIVFQRRQDGSEDFYRNWTDYQSGFGKLSGEFWLGNDNLLKLTSQGTWELRVDLGDWEGNTAWAKYTTFRITGEKYTLHIGEYDADSTAGDSLDYHRGKDFSTKDKDNDRSSSRHCAQKHMGGWWFRGCAEAHLNGYYHKSKDPDEDGGIEWHHWKSGYSMKSCSMKIRSTYI